MVCQRKTMKYFKKCNTTLIWAWVRGGEGVAAICKKGVRWGASEVHQY